MPGTTYSVSSFFFFSIRKKETVKELIFMDFLMSFKQIFGENWIQNCLLCSLVDYPCNLSFLEMGIDEEGCVQTVKNYKNAFDVSRH